MTDQQPQGAAVSPDPDGDVLRVEHISKKYGAVTALVDVNMHLRRGEVLGLIGDNGAGKSTLIKIICGFQPPTSGRIFLDGQEITFKSVDHARSLGIDVVYQDLALVNQLTVYENMFLNREPVRWPLLRKKQMRKEAQEHLDSIPAASGRPSRWPARCSPTPRSCCSTSRWPPWASRKAR